MTFTDGYAVDHKEFEELFTREYDIDNCIYSLSSYFKYNFYGKVSFDFTFVYYYSGMSCAEAYKYVNGEDEHGHFVGNQFLRDIFQQIRTNPNKYGIDNFKSLDGDGDGLVDLSMFVLAEDSSKTNPSESGNYGIYGSALGTADKYDYPPDKTLPQIRYFIKTGYESVLTPPDTDGYRTASGIREIIHETAHAFGVSDYYDFHSYEGKIISAFGGFDMHEQNIGDMNPYSKFCAGILEPYVVSGIEDSITIKLGCSSEKNQAILIPTSKGWNGTPFDEYILVDVMAPVGANGFDWDRATSPYEPLVKVDGGVRVIHVDARLMYENAFIDPYTAKAMFDNGDISSNTKAFYCTNGIDPQIPGQSRYYHLAEIVPSDGSSCYRISTPPKVLYAIVHRFNTGDLFGPGDVFSMETCRDAFASYPLMNNGGTLDYTVKVEHYDAETHEAIVTITRIK